VASLDHVALLVAELPEVAEGERRGGRSWAVCGKVFAWERAFSKADLRRFGDVAPPQGAILAVRVEDLGEKEAALAAHPPHVFTIPHFDGYPAVLVELAAASVPLLREVLVDGWLACAPRSLAEEYLHGGGQPGGGQPGG
jgi:hypothetical protein